MKYLVRYYNAGARHDYKEHIFEIDDPVNELGDYIKGMFSRNPSMVILKIVKQ